MRKNYFVYMFILLLIVVIITSLFIKFTVITATIVITISGWLSFGFKILYSNWDWLYKKIQKIRFVLTNPDTIWNMTVRYEKEINQEIVGNLRSYLFSGEDLKNVKFSYLPSGDLEIRSEGMILQFFFNENSLEVHMLDFPVTYNKALNTIDNVILPLLDKIDSIIKADKNKITYFLKVSFDYFNPYYGLYLSKIPKNDIINFDVKFIVDSNRVEVTKNSVIITSFHKSQLSNLTKEYLTFSLNK